MSSSFLFPKSYIQSDCLGLLDSPTLAFCFYSSLSGRGHLSPRSIISSCYFSASGNNCICGRREELASRSSAPRLSAGTGTLRLAFRASLSRPRYFINTLLSSFHSNFPSLFLRFLSTPPPSPFLSDHCRSLVSFSILDLKLVVILTAKSIDHRCSRFLAYLMICENVLAQLFSSLHNFFF